MTFIDARDTGCRRRRSEVARPRSTIPRPARHSERGSASILVLGVGLVVLLLAIGVAALGTAFVTRHRAQTAADAAALAAAAYAWHGTDVACSHAARLADANTASLTDCRLSGADALVTVTVDGPLSRAGFPAAEARARAGPVGA